MSAASLLPGLVEAPSVTEIGVEGVDEAVKAGRPFVVRDCPGLIPARKHLTLDSLRSILGDTVISVEHKHRWNSAKQTISASDYLKRIEETDFYWRQANLRIAELRTPKLPAPSSIRADTIFFDSLWVGPGGTVQTFHQDNHDDLITNSNLFCQIIGSKYIAIASPEESSYFRSYPLNQHTDRHSLASPFDSETARRCPSFAQAVLQGGDMIYMPPRYWHYVQSLSVSVSISRWWFSSRLAEMLYASAVGVHDHPPAGNADWSHDIKELGGVETLRRYTDRLPNAQKCAINLRLILTYGEGVLDYGAKGRV